MPLPPATNQNPWSYLLQAARSAAACVWQTQAQTLRWAPPAAPTASVSLGAVTPTPRSVWKSRVRPVSVMRLPHCTFLPTNYPILQPLSLLRFSSRPCMARSGHYHAAFPTLQCHRTLPIPVHAQATRWSWVCALPARVPCASTRLAWCRTAAPGVSALLSLDVCALC